MCRPRKPRILSRPPKRGTGMTGWTLCAERQVYAYRSVTANCALGARSARAAPTLPRRRLPSSLHSSVQTPPASGRSWRSLASPVPPALPALVSPLPALPAALPLPLLLGLGGPVWVAGRHRPDGPGQQDRAPGPGDPERPGEPVRTGEYPDRETDETRGYPTAPDHPQPRVPVPHGRRGGGRRRWDLRHLGPLRGCHRRQVVQQLVQLAGGTRGVGLLQPLVVLAEVEPALVQRVAEPVGHVLPVRIGRPHLLPSLRHATLPRPLASRRC